MMASPVRAWEPDRLPPGYTLAMNAGTAHMSFADGDGVVRYPPNGSVLELIASQLSADTPTTQAAVETSVRAAIHDGRQIAFQTRR